MFENAKISFVNQKIWVWHLSILFHRRLGNEAVDPREGMKVVLSDSKSPTLIEAGKAAAPSPQSTVVSMVSCTWLQDTENSRWPTRNKDT